MPQTNAQLQAAYRTRRANREARMRSALENIIAELGDNAKPLAVKLRTLAQEGLL